MWITLGPRRSSLLARALRWARFALANAYMQLPCQIWHAPPRATRGGSPPIPLVCHVSHRRIMVSMREPRGKVLARTVLKGCGLKVDRASKPRAARCPTPDSEQRLVRSSACHKDVTSQNRERLVSI